CTSATSRLWKANGPSRHARRLSLLDLDVMFRPFTAHPKIDTVTGELLFFGYDYTAPYLRYHVADKGGNLVRTEAIDIPRTAMIHDFGVTATKVVWPDRPVVFDAELIHRQPFHFTWRPEHGARVGVMPRTGGNADVTWTDIDPCYVYHVL